ncbi:MAG: 2-hydroxychromene-2-carboxylate isomerase [Myxococcales bacterium]|nr:2-hydroxychromene-2-carboxylate isomerase [Myxococcales bacterium]
MGARVLRYYFDFISPYAYLGWGPVQGLAERCAVVLQPVPVLFAAFLDAHGHKGPAEIEPKRIYTFKHVVRLAHDLGVPLRPPPAHPFNPLLALRVATAASPEQQVAVIDALYRRTWGTGEGVTTPADVQAALEAVGLPGAALVAEATNPEVKARLRRATEDALSRGIFGVPSMEVDGEVFWGQDAMPHVERFLSGDDPVPSDLLERWCDLPTGATRPAAQRGS